MYGTIILIAVLYLAALFGEVLQFRSVKPSSFCRSMIILTAFTAFLWQGGFLYAYHVAEHQTLSGAKLYFEVSAWGLALLYLYWTFLRRSIPFGLILLPMIVLLLVAGLLISEKAVVSTGQQQPLLKMLHTVMFFLATLSISVGFVAGLLYLIQDNVLKRKRVVPSSMKLPTLEWSLTICRDTTWSSFIFLALCMLSGMSMLTGSARIPVLYDPLIFGTVSMFIFLALFFVASFFKLWKTDGRSVAVMTLVSFLFLVSMLAVGIFAGQSHWG
jgi:hypothetical protein